MKLPEKRIDRYALLFVALVIVALGGHWARSEALKRGWILHNAYDLRSEGLLRVGDLAPDLPLVAAGDEAPVSISDLYRERPAVLIFGSYT